MVKINQGVIPPQYQQMATSTPQEQHDLGRQEEDIPSIEEFA